MVVERADRFGRNDTEALRAIDELDEFGVAVRFANQPNLDPIDADDRIIVALSFTLARRELILSGLRIKIALPGEERLGKLTGSTSNASRSGGGTAYYCVPRSDINLLCSDIDAQIPLEIMRIQVNPDLLPAIRDCYTQEVAQKLGHLRPDERTELEAALKSIDDEEARMVRLFAAGKITEAIWDNLWAEWQDRCQHCALTSSSMDVQQDYHINNLDVALRIIAKVGLLYSLHLPA